LYLTNCIAHEKRKGTSREYAPLKLTFGQRHLQLTLDVRAKKTF